MNRLQRAHVCCRPSLSNQELLVAVSAVKSEIDGLRGGHPADGVADRGVRTLASWILLAVIAMIGLLSSRALGQAAADRAAIRSVPLQAAFTDRAAVAVLERAKSEGLSKADFSPQWAGYENFKQYYQQYQFGKLMDASYVAQYGEITQSILDDLDRSQKARSPAARALSGWIVAGSKAIATNNFHPVARVNATLMLAQTDDQPADLRAAKPPVPAAAALPILVQLYMGTGNPDGVRAAALQGLLRHVQLGAVTDPRFRSGIAKLALDLIESEPPAGRSPAAHAFLQRYGVDILTLIADPNTTAKTAETFVSISTQAAKPNLIAAYAASKIGRFQPGKAKVSNASNVLASWAARAAETVDQEIERIAQLDPPLAVRDQPAMPTSPTAGGSAGAMGMGMGMPGGEMMGGDYDPSMMGGMEGMMPGSDMMGGEMYGEGMLGMPGMMGVGGPPAIPQPLEIVTARRSINHIFQQLQTGVTGQRTVGPPKQPGGLMAAADPAEKEAIDAWVATFSEVATAVNDKTLVDRKKFVEMLTEQSKVLKELAGIEVIDEPTNPAGLDVGNPLGAELGATPLQPAGVDPSPAGSAVANPAGPNSGAASVTPAAVPNGAPAVPGVGSADPLADPLAAPGSDPLADPN